MRLSGETQDYHVTWLDTDTVRLARILMPWEEEVWKARLEQIEEAQPRAQQRVEKRAHSWWRRFFRRAKA